MKKRSCKRFSIPGTTLYYKVQPGFFSKPDYPDTYFPVLNISRGGASFLCNERMKAGKKLVLKMNIPGQDFPLEILASVKWISKNPEESYAYRTGVAFNTYGSSRNENPTTVLEQIQSME